MNMFLAYPSHKPSFLDEFPIKKRSFHGNIKDHGGFSIHVACFPRLFGSRGGHFVRSLVDWEICGDISSGND